MGIYQFLRKQRLPYWCCGALAGMLVIIFGQISGMEISTERAVIMFLLMLFGNILGMAYDTVTALSFSALLQMWQNPYCLWYAGFLFSYSAVLAVVVVAPILKKEKENVKQISGFAGVLKNGQKKILETLFVSASIQLVTLPLTVYFYYELPVYSVLINGLLLPFMNLLLIAGILGGILGLFWSGASWLLLRPAYFLLKWNEWICGKFETLPGANWITGKPPFLLIVLYYGILIGILFFLYRQKENKEESWKCNVAKIVIGISLLLLLTIQVPKGFQMHFLDVGQGDGICIVTENKEVFFIDGGSSSENKVGEYRILSFLKYHGISHVDGWFVSHADEDHVSGLMDVWESGYRISNLFLAENIVKDEAWEKLCVSAEKYNTGIIYLEPKEKVISGELEFICLMPGKKGTDRNRNSMVLYWKYKEMTGLFTGDITKEEEKTLLQVYPKLQADIYKAAHHGSNGSNGKEWLQQLNPVVSVVSCGRDNSYGHPGEQAIENIKASGSEIFYTMRSGQITIGYQNGKITVKEYLFAKP